MSFFIKATYEKGIGIYMSQRIDSSSLSFVPFNYKIHGDSSKIDNGFQQKIYYYNRNAYVVTNEIENTYANLQNYYCNEQEPKDSMDELCTPYVKLTQDMLGNNENSVNFIPGSTFYFSDPSLEELNLNEQIKINITNDGIEAYYGNELIASSTYISELEIKILDSVKYINIQEEIASGRYNQEFHNKLDKQGMAGHMFPHALSVLLKSVDKVIRAANGQLDISKLNISDETRFQEFLTLTNIDLDYTKEFTINGQKLTFNNICLNDNFQKGTYLKLEYVGTPRDASTLEFLESLGRPSNRIKDDITSTALFRQRQELSMPNEKPETPPISQIILEQWNNYIQVDSNAAKELLIEKNKMRNWNEFFKEREKLYKEKDDNINAQQCKQIANYLEISKI